METNHSTIPYFAKEMGIEELFLTLYFLKSPSRNLATTASCFHVHPQTLMKWVDITLSIIIDVLPEVKCDHFNSSFELLNFSLI